MYKKILKLIAVSLLLAGNFSCTKDDNTSNDNLVSINIQNFRGEVDPNIVSFALPGIVDARCFNAIPYPNFVGFTETWNPNDWSINLVMAKKTDRTKLAPIIALVPGATITPVSGTVLDFTKNIEWTLKAPDGTTVKYYVTSLFVIDDADEDNMASVKIRCMGTGAVDPNIISLALPGLVNAGGYERLPEPNYGGFPEAWSPHYWTIHLIMAKGTDCTKLAPIITLAPGATITEKFHFIGEQLFSEQVDYTGIAKVGVYDFTKQVECTLRAPDGSEVSYIFLATAIGADLGPCVNCP
jgi:hypothetical protein